MTVHRILASVDHRTAVVDHMIAEVEAHRTAEEEGHIVAVVEVAAGHIVALAVHIELVEQVRRIPV